MKQKTNVTHNNTRRDHIHNDHTIWNTTSQMYISMNERSN